MREPDAARKLREAACVFVEGIALPATDVYDRAGGQRNSKLLRSAITYAKAKGYVRKGHDEGAH